MIGYVMLGYLILTSIIFGVLMHFEVNLLVLVITTLMWPLMIVLSPFWGIVVLTNKILDVVDKWRGKI